jgi:hypothetical protein
VIARSNLTRLLYRLSLVSATGRFVRKSYVTRRARNITVGRALGRPGVWRRLWGKWAMGDTEIIVDAEMAPDTVCVSLAADLAGIKVTTAAEVSPVVLAALNPELALAVAALIDAPEGGDA